MENPNGREIVSGHGRLSTHLDHTPAGTSVFTCAAPGAGRGREAVPPDERPAGRHQSEFRHPLRSLPPASFGPGGAHLPSSAFQNAAVLCAPRKTATAPSSSSSRERCRHSGPTEPCATHLGAPVPGVHPPEYLPSEEYEGTAAFSEPEARITRDAAKCAGRSQHWGRCIDRF